MMHSNNRRRIGWTARLFVRRSVVVVTALLVSGSAGQVFGDDWPQWGRDASKNMYSPNETGLVSDFSPGVLLGRTSQIDPASTKNIRWIANLGSNTYGNPTVADGRVYIGTNNELPRDEKLKGDRSNVYCLDEQTGELIWQFSATKLGAGKVGDWEYLGICSSPTVVDGLVYFVTNRGEVACLDADGLADGNDGPYKDEGQYMAGQGGTPMDVGEKDADIIWLYDMIDDLGVFPHNITSSSVLVAGGRVYVSTSNGVDYSHKHIINPTSPSLIVLDAATGKLIGEETSGISERIMHCNWSSPAMGDADGVQQLIFGAGDGQCYGYDPQPKAGGEGYDVLDELWRFDCNVASYREVDSRPVKYATYDGPSEIIATPVMVDGRVYVAIGQDPEHGEGVGALSCIDATKRGETTESGLVWQFRDIGRTISTVAVADGLIYAADYAGWVYCLDAETGEVQWQHDTMAHIWGSPLVADGKVYLGNEDGVMTILKAGRELEVLAEVEFAGPLYSSAIAANGVVYVATMTHLYAIGQ